MIRKEWEITDARKSIKGSIHGKEITPPHKVIKGNFSGKSATSYKDGKSVWSTCADVTVKVIEGREEVFISANGTWTPTVRDLEKLIDQIRAARYNLKYAPQIPEG